MVTGTGFPKKTSGVVTAGPSSVAFTASASGYFTAALVIPQSADPVVPVQATAAKTGASAPFTLTYGSPSPTTSGPVAASTVPAPASAAPSTAPLRFGVGTPGGPLAAAELEEVTALAGEAPSIILSYKDFNQAPPLAELDAARTRGATVLLTWEPWAWGGGTVQPAYSLDRITAGDFDPYLRQWGQALANWGHPVMLRFGHEMNGNWYPWSEQVNGNGAGDYVAAWRHVHDVVASTGASNISWVWNPNVPYWGSAALEGLYPGASYVDTVALDGYNWGTSASWSTWTSPSQLFAGGLSQLRTLAPGKQIMIAETSSAEQGGSKADWNLSLISYLAAQGDVTAVTWFHFNKETDWRINSSSASAQALNQALAARPK
ncbi:glycoside hydrolase family 26 protein [Pseudarthrobacter albicanus]|uniref:glycoside hydrolase family 26 protein n=1 Tax=Pseudarthrobacter albicanus TaxID=2823873 RepID=UPI0027DB79D9|nr:glycosyl hydrolase [Pseudarthrobacter albicanus]